MRLDLGQAEQILINLVVNARDAMLNGGTLTIETANVVLDREYCLHHANTTPGRYVMLVVSDDGCGMSTDTMRHIFEPFFTTKEHGRGTGLGLTMVHGAVHQNRGTISVTSDLGKGTTFRICLPKMDDAAEDIQVAPVLGSVAGHETIVLVEDNERVRAFGCRILERQAYRVHADGNGGDALVALRSMDRKIDLVITDVVMPGMNGKVFAEKAQELIPGIQVLFTSGYTQNVIVHRGVLDPGLELLAKPYSHRELVTRVRSILESSP